MGGRYYITGVQLGTIRSLASVYLTKYNIEIVELIDLIIESQFIKNIEITEELSQSHCEIRKRR
jgi:hypothetical protein